MTSFWQAWGLMWRYKAPTNDDSGTSSDTKPALRKKQAALVGLTLVLLTLVLLILAAFNYPFYLMHHIHTNIQNIVSVHHQTNHRQTQLTVVLAKRILMSQNDPIQDPLVFQNLDFVLDGPKEEVAFLRNIIEERNGSVGEACTEDKTCIRMAWDAAQTSWTIDTQASASETTTSAGALNTLYAHMINAALLYEHQQEKNMQLEVTEEDVLKSLQQITSEGFVLVLHIMFGAAAVFMTMAGGSFTGLMFDRQRNMGTLEPLVMAHHAPWVMYGYTMMKESALIVGIYIATVGLMFAWKLPLNGSFALALGWMVLGLSVLAGAWGMLVTVLFHSSRGRLWATLVLSPLTFSLLWGFRMGLYWTSLKTHRPAEALDLARHVVHESAAWFWGVGFLALLLSAGVLWVVHWRMGIRREGMRKAL